MNYRPYFYILFISLLPFFSAYIMQGVQQKYFSHEEFIQTLLDDSQYGFHHFMEKYQKDSLTYFKYISQLYDSSIDDGVSPKEYFIQFGITKAQRDKYAEALERICSDWEKEEPQKGNDIIQIYKIKYENGDFKEFNLYWNDIGVGMLHMEVKCSDCTYPLATRSVPLNRLFHKKGKEDFVQILKSAESGFTDMIIPSSLKDNVYQVKSRYLNPTELSEPLLTIIEREDERILQIKPSPAYSKVNFAFNLIHHWDYEYVTFITGDEWNTDGSESYYTSTKALPDGKYIVVRRRIGKDNNDFLEIVSSNMKPLPTAEVEANEKQKELEKHLGCKSGNCINGFGKMNYLDPLYEGEVVVTYEGPFKDGKFHGLGKVTHYGMSSALRQGLTDQIEKDELPHIIGRFSEGELMKEHVYINSYSAIYDKYSLYLEAFKNDFVLREKFNLCSEAEDGIALYAIPTFKDKDGKEEKTYDFFIYNTSAPHKRIEINLPFSTDFGRCISGTCGKGSKGVSGDDYGKLKLEDIGVFEGQFWSDGSAKKGKLTLESGDVLGVTCDKGIPYQFQNIIVPKGSSRYELAKEDAWLLQIKNMCLEGDCTAGGKGISQIVFDCNGERRWKHKGFFKGEHADWISPKSGTGKYISRDGLITYDNPSFKCNRLDGQFKRTLWTGDEKKIRFKEDVRYTLDGTETYDKYVKRIHKEEFDRAVAEAVAEAVAASAKKRAEREARETLERKKAQKARAQISAQAKSSYQSSYCHSCRGTGSYWHEWTEKNCTTTYDYTYSSGKYYQTYENCDDVKKGGYIVCPVCGGDGRK